MINMSNGVEFEEDQFGYGRKPFNQGGQVSQGVPVSNTQFANYGSARAEPKMTQWLMRHGFVKSPKGAQVILIAVVIINIIITFVVIKFFL